MLPTFRPIPRPAVTDRPRAFPTLDRAFDAVERALARLGVEDPASLRSPTPVEDELSANALPAGTLLVLEPGELLAAEDDVLETVKDERAGGCVFVAYPERSVLMERKPTLRETGTICPTFLFAQEGPLSPGFNRLRRVNRPIALRGYRFVVADTPGFKVVVVSRALPGGGFVGLWSGDERVIAEVTGVLRAAATAAGHEVPAPAAPVPALEGIERVEDVWKQAAELRAHRVVREAELREIARAAALKGVQMRRDREAELAKRAS